MEYVHEHEGQVARQRLCGQCLTRIYSTTAAPGMVVLRAGTLDISQTPAAHIWTRHKQPWLVLPAEVPAWAESPAPEEFARAVMAG